MKVAYFVPFRGGRETGIYRKVAEHCEEWTRLGAEVGLFTGTSAAAVGDWEAIPSSRRVVAMPREAVATIRARESLWRSMRSWKPDVVYARHGLVHPGALWTASSTPVVLEINSNDVGEFGATSRWRSMVSRVTRDQLLSRAAGLVFISHELSKLSIYDSGPSHRIAIGNGIRLAAYPEFAAPSNGSPHLVFIGHPGSIWHGLDHLLEMARAFPGWHFDIIGAAQAELPDAPPNVRAHGVMFAEDYQPILRQADAAVGSLALYRNEMAEGSPLKVREYLARGIPTIIGYRETDFMRETQFLLEIPNTPDGVSSSLGQIDAFVRSASSVRVSHAQVANLDVSVKEAQRLEFISAAAHAHR